MRRLARGLCTASRIIEGEWAGWECAFDARGQQKEIPEFFTPTSFVQWDRKVWGFQSFCGEQIINKDNIERRATVILPEAGCSLDNELTTKPEKVSQVPITAHTEFSTLYQCKMDRRAKCLRMEFAWDAGSGDTIVEGHGIPTGDGQWRRRMLLELTLNDQGEFQPKSSTIWHERRVSTRALSRSTLSRVLDIWSVNDLIGTPCFVTGDHTRHDALGGLVFRVEFTGGSNAFHFSDCTDIAQNDAVAIPLHSYVTNTCAIWGVSANQLGLDCAVGKFMLCTGHDCQHVF